MKTFEITYRYGVTDWLTANEPRVREFLSWASKYSWPGL